MHDKERTKIMVAADLPRGFRCMVRLCCQKGTENGTLDSLILLLSSSVVSFKETKPLALACLVLRVHSQRHMWRGWPVPGCSNGGSVQAWLTDGLSGHCRKRKPARVCRQLWTHTCSREPESHSDKATSRPWGGPEACRQWWRPNRTC